MGHHRISAKGEASFTRENQKGMNSGGADDGTGKSGKEESLSGEVNEHLVLVQEIQS